MEPYNAQLELGAVHSHAVTTVLYCVRSQGPLPSLSRGMFWLQTLVAGWVGINKCVWPDEEVQQASRRLQAKFVSSD